MKEELYTELVTVSRTATVLLTSQFELYYCPNPSSPYGLTYQYPTCLLYTIIVDVKMKPYTQKSPFFTRFFCFQLRNEAKPHNRNGKIAYSLTEQGGMSILRTYTLVIVAPQLSEVSAPINVTQFPVPSTFSTIDSSWMELLQARRVRKYSPFHLISIWEVSRDLLQVTAQLNSRQYSPASTSRGRLYGQFLFTSRSATMVSLGQLELNKDPLPISPFSQSQPGSSLINTQSFGIYTCLKSPLVSIFLGLTENKGLPPAVLGWKTLESGSFPPYMKIGSNAAAPSGMNEMNTQKKNATIENYFIFPVFFQFIDY